MNIVTNRFYVYTYSYANGTPFYVGKGTGNRDIRHIKEAKSKKINVSNCVKILRNLFNSNNTYILKRIVDNIDNEFACLIEQEYIAKYGRKDLGTGILINATNGGDPGMTYIPEVREKIIKKLIEGGKKTRFTKGQEPWNKGKKLDKALVEKLKASGFCAKKGAIPWNKGIKLSAEQKAKQFSLAAYVKKHGIWNKGLKMKKDLQYE